MLRAVTQGWCHSEPAGELAESQLPRTKPGCNRDASFLSMTPSRCRGYWSRIRRGWLGRAPRARDRFGSPLPSSTGGEEGRHERRVSGYVADRGRHSGHRCALHAGGRSFAGEPGQRRRRLRLHLGIIPHMAAAILGLAALLHASALAFQTLKYLGVVYLLYMAWNTLREQGALRVEADVDARSARQIIVSAILVNILNPKLSIFFLAFLPQFVQANDPDTLARMAGLSAVFMLLTFIVFVGYGLGAAALRRHVLTRPQVMTWMRRVFAGAFVALGARLALAER
jgi:threonine/homoserine/homoserine lactone efflux protein